jgi:hypothetical protein
MGVIVGVGVAVGAGVSVGALVGVAVGAGTVHVVVGATVTVGNGVFVGSTGAHAPSKKASAASQQYAPTTARWFLDNCTL